MTDLESTERSCNTCRYWEAIGKRGDCRRRAPSTMPNALWLTSKALALLLWWYAREHSDEETANEQWKTWGLNIENEEPYEAHWATTAATDWCGEWEATHG